jgi:Putative Actinobacterial Holin-X, holin superfamily III
MRPTLELLDLFDQVRELMRVELSLVRAEISERTSGLPSRLTAVVVGVVLLPLAIGLILVAVSLFLLRFGIPLDLAFLIVAVVAIAVSLLLLRLGVAGLKPSRFMPAKSMSQISSLIGGLSSGRERLDIG